MKQILYLIMSVVVKLHLHYFRLNIESSNEMIKAGAAVVIVNDVAELQSDLWQLSL